MVPIGEAVGQISSIVHFLHPHVKCILCSKNEYGAALLSYGKKQLSDISYRSLVHDDAA